MPIVIERVEKRFGAVRAVDGLDLVIEDGRFVCLLGPSGCGKTTTLRMLAGLEFPDHGQIRTGERVLSDGDTGRFVSPEARGIGLVFQSYALWPHMTVAQNIAFGLEVRRWPRERREVRVRELMDLLRISGLGDRYPSQLSGGQQQRVALARSLAPGTELLLLDEPLSNLDAQLRLEMRAELKRLHERLGTTIVFVTHDQLEAMTMATDVAVMHEGKLQQYGAPMDVYRRPANTFVAGFIGSPTINLLTAGDRTTGELASSVLRWLSARRPGLAARTIGIRPESLAIADVADANGRWTHRADVEAVLPTGAEWIVRLRALGATLFALTTRDPDLRSGTSVTLAVDHASIHLFDEGGSRIDEPTPAPLAIGARA
ncbi:MAG: ABC transporter ATP-binding protein [Chloroflexi bacterium]|nr:MAG: ABC transporter ATP-binding protein [Chloroflexota bacterium]